MATTAETTSIPGIPRRDTSTLTGKMSYLWWWVRRYPLIPAAILILLVITAILGPLLQPYSEVRGEIEDVLLPPLSTSEKTGNFYLMGTDHAGRDEFSRILGGARITMMVVSISLSVGLTVGTTLGVIGGYFGGIVDEISTRAVDIWQALPFLLVALVMALVFGRGLEVLLVVLALISWVAFVRVIRSQVLVLRELDYIAAARISGASEVRIIWRHIVPGIVNTAVVVATINVGGLILAEATLSFVGAGIQPPTPAWGVMTSEARDYLTTAWWLVAMPAIAIFLVVISVNFLGDWLRDRLDPTLRQVD